MTDPNPRYRDIIADHIRDMDRWEVLWYVFVFFLGTLLSAHGVTIW